MSNSDAVRITNLKEIFEAELAPEDVFEIVDMNGDPNANPASRQVKLGEVAGYIRRNTSFDRYNIFSFQTEIADNSIHKFNDDGDIQRNSGFAILQVEEEGSQGDYKGDLAVYTWTNDSTTSGPVASVSLVMSTNPDFTATSTTSTGPGSIDYNGSHDDQVKFYVGSSSDNEPPMWIANANNNNIKIRLNVF